MSIDELKAWLADGDTTQPVEKAWTQSASPTAGITAYGNSGEPAKKKRKRVRLLPAP